MSAWGAQQGVVHLDGQHAMSGPPDAPRGLVAVRLAHETQGAPFNGQLLAPECSQRRARQRQALGDLVEREPALGSHLASLLASPRLAARC
jgi:hypothetical protein